jgi:hypothetical protein
MRSNEINFSLLKIVRFVFLGLMLALGRPAQAGQRGMIDDPDGYVNLREDKSEEAPRREGRKSPGGSAKIGHEGGAAETF